VSAREPARLSPTHDDAVRQLERLSDRLRVIGPRLGARDGAEAATALAAIRAALQQLADLAADADGEPRRPVPELAPHALADQALVLGTDLLGANPRTDLFRRAAVALIDELRALL
jgi:hypothetical protein